jgi:hypothetical protein
MLALREETKRLTALLAPSFAPKTTIALADAIHLEYAAPTNGVAVAVLQQFFAGTVGTQKDFGRVRKRLAFIKKGLNVVAGLTKKKLSPECLAARLALPFFLAPATSYPKALTVEQQAKANAARAEAEAARSGGG